MFFNYLLLTNEQMETKREDVRLEKWAWYSTKRTSAQSFSFLFSLSQSPRADPGHEAIPRMGYPEWDALCALFDHSFPTITITSTTPIYHLDLSITPSSNPWSPAQFSSDNIVNPDQKRKFGNQLKLHSSTMVNIPRSYENVSSRILLRDTFRIFNFISKISSLRYIKEHPVRRSPSSCSIQLKPRKSSCWFSNFRCWYTKKTD